MYPDEIKWIEHDEMCKVVEVIVPMEHADECCHTNLGIHREHGWEDKARRGEPYTIRCSDCEGVLRVLFHRREFCQCGNKVEWTGEFDYRFSNMCD